MTCEAGTARLAQRFSDAAASYDAAAAVQASAAEALATTLPAGFVPRQIVDLGCGTGLLAASLRKHFPAAGLTGLDIAEGMVARCRAAWDGDGAASFDLADIDRAPLPEPAGLVASSFAFQWLADGPATAQRWAGAVAPQGRLALAVPVAGSLEGLAQRYAQTTGRAFPGLAYAAPEAYEAAVAEAGLVTEHSAVSELPLAHGEPMAALRALRRLGATTPRADADGPATAGELRRVLRDWPAEAALSFNVLYLVARREAT